MLKVFATITEVTEQTSGVLEEGRFSDLLERVEMGGVKKKTSLLPQCRRVREGSKHII